MKRRNYRKVSDKPPITLGTPVSPTAFASTATTAYVPRLERPHINTTAASMTSPRRTRNKKPATILSPRPSPPRTPRTPLSGRSSVRAESVLQIVEIEENEISAQRCLEAPRTVPPKPPSPPQPVYQYYSPDYQSHIRRPTTANAKKGRASLLGDAPEYEHEVRPPNNITIGLTIKNLFRNLYRWPTLGILYFVYILDD